jgi:predicted lipid-binding transport protein (Tim44 family)
MRRYGVLLALLTVASCSQDKAGTLPPLSPVPSATSATPTPSATPDGAGAEVEAAARAYYAALTAAGQTGDVRALRAAVDPRCDCAQQIAAVESEHRAGRRYTTRYVVDAVSTHEVSGGSGYATVTLTYADSQVVDGAGRTVRRIPGKTRVGRDLLFRKEGTTWRLVRIVLLG